MIGYALQMLHFASCFTATKQQQVYQDKYKDSYLGKLVDNGQKLISMFTEQAAKRNVRRTGHRNFV